MAKTLTANARVFISSIWETFWAIGAGGVAGHLSAYVHSLRESG